MIAIRNGSYPFVRSSDYVDYIVDLFDTHGLENAIVVGHSLAGLWLQLLLQKVRIELLPPFTCKICREANWVVILLAGQALVGWLGLRWSFIPFIIPKLKRLVHTTFLFL